MVALLGCGNHAQPATPTRVPDAGAAVVEPGPDDAECNALIDHAIDLQTRDAGISTDDRKKVSSEVRAPALERCRALPRTVYRCAMAATTIEALTGCDPTS